MLKISFHKSKNTTPVRLALNKSRTGYGGIFRKHKWLLAVLCTAALLTAVTYYTISHLSQANVEQKQSSTNPSGEPSKLQKGTPDYTTIAPRGVSIDSLGGWTRVSPPDRNPVFAYVQALDSATISVSQQPVPDSLQSNPKEGLESLAKDFRANEMIMAGDTPIHIETKNNGAQSVLFIKKDVLVLIKSSKNVANSSWIDYVSSLE